MNRSAESKWAVRISSLLVFSLLSISSGWAQYPTKPINLLIGAAAGGATSITLRTLSDAAGKILGQPIVLLNKPGGGGAVALVLLKNEKPDGYTLGNINAAGVLSQYMRKVPYDALTDFTPIIRYGDYTYGVVIRAESPWKTFQELIEYAKANPGKIKFSTSGAGTFHHLVMEVLARQEGIKWTHIPYKGGHEATTAILGGHVDVEACSSEWKPYVESGKLRLLSTYNPNRLPKFPDVPTWVELGYKIAANGGIGVVGPKGLSRPIVDKLHGAYKKAMDDPTFRKSMEIYDMPIAYRDPEGLGKDIKELGDKWGKLIVDFGIKE
ncbi:MAG: tripartite tricarboxylate transporter substrate binding protein [Thermodesulfobacteriota bacterium]|jgi:tripartite-type tricarboxylate transporter receptor subunit TctC